MEEEKLMCPLCKAGELVHEVVVQEDVSATGVWREWGVTHMWECNACPAVLMEWHDTSDMMRLKRRLNNGKE